MRTAQRLLHNARGGNPPLTYSQAVLESAPDSYWRLQDSIASGAAVDLVGGKNGTRGTNVAIWSHVAAPIAEAGAVGLKRTGTVDAIVFGDVYDVLGTNPLSLEFWARFDGTDTTGDIMGKVVPGSSGYIALLNASKLRFTRHTGGVTVTVETPGTVTDNAWHHYVATYNGANLKLYQDSALVAGPTASALSEVNNNDPFTILGAESGIGTIAQAQIAEPAFYLRELLSDEIGEHWAARLIA